MNPLLVTGLVAVGHKLVDHLMTKQPEPASSHVQQEGQFDRYLTSQSVQQPSDLIAYLESNKIHAGVDLQALQFQLRQQLFNQPELATFMASADRTAGFQLKLEDTGLYTLSDSRGRQITFNDQTKQGQLAKRIGQLSRMESIAETFPGYGMRDLAHRAEVRPEGEMHWHLPGLN